MEAGDSSIGNTYRRAINDADEKANGGDASSDFPVLYLRELISNDADNDTGKSDGGSSAQYEEHEEKKNGKYLRHESEFCKCLGIRNKCESCARTNDSADVLAAKFVSQISEDPENGRPSDETREEIERCYYYAISVKIQFSFPSKSHPISSVYDFLFLFFQFFQVPRNVVIEIVV